MTPLEDEWLCRLTPPAAAERRFRSLTLLGAAVCGAYLVATLAGAPKSVSSLVLSSLIALVPFLAWWAYTRTDESVRRPVALLATASTLWLLGELVWQGSYFAGGDKVPHPPGVWDAFFASAGLLVIVALFMATRSFISLRLAALDASVIVVAGLTLAAPFVSGGLAQRATAGSVFDLNAAVLSLVTLILIGSAALGPWEGLPRSLALLGLAEIPLMIGNLLYSYQAVQGEYADARWANVAWGSAAVIVMLAAGVIILGVDRPMIRVSARTRIPNHVPCTRAVLLLSLGALALTISVSCYGLMAESRDVALIGLIASVTVGAAMAVRARDSIRTAEDAYERLDRTLVKSEHEKDELTLANDELRKANVQMRVTQLAFSDLLNLADERTEGRMRGLIEVTGGDLAALLEEELYSDQM